MDLIYFLHISNALHYELLYNFWSEETWMMILIYSQIVTALSFFMKNFIPLNQGHFIEDLIQTSS